MTGFRATPRPRPTDPARGPGGERPVRTSPPDADEMVVLTQVLHGLAFPARTWQLVMTAEHFGADRPTLERLQRLPDASFSSLLHVGAACAALSGARRP